LASQGITIALVATDAGRLADVVAEIDAKGGDAASFVADISDPAQVVACAQAADDELDGVDLLVNAAGLIDAEVPLWEADIDQWWRVMEVNLRGPMLLARAIVPQMIEDGGGRIVDLNSGSGTYDMSVSSAYNLSKTALMRIGAGLHDAGHTQGLRTFEVAPGVVETDMTASMPMHVGRTQWTPVARTVDMVTAIASGDLDACSGWFIRVTEDTPASLRQLAAADLPTDARRLRVHPAGQDDPLAPLLLGR
jgi:NAD(P)-dependent dehydrogenase (short-subunit alcohol dehydrogenase family)